MIGAEARALADKPANQEWAQLPTAPSQVNTADTSCTQDTSIPAHDPQVASKGQGTQDLYGYRGNFFAKYVRLYIMVDQYLSWSTNIYHGRPIFIISNTHT